MDAGLPDSELPLSVRLRIDECCDQFEQQWRAGEQPSIESYLAGWSDAEAKALFVKLLEIDNDYRERTGSGGASVTYSSGLRRIAATLDAAMEQTASPAEARSPAPAPPAQKISNNRFLPGELLADRYRIVALLGRGGMGEVYRAEDIRLGQTVALKFLPEQQVTDARHLQYFYGEVRLSQRLAHPHICRVHDLLEIGPLRCLSMEYIEGENLQTLLRRIGPLPEPKGLELAHQICQGLAAAHNAGILHRDLKTANIMIDERGRARITDFGLARERDQTDPAEALVGSPAYMAPEQLAKNQTSIQSDLYSLGLILLEILTGQPMHRSKSLDAIAQMQTEETAKQIALETTTISVDVATAIASCLSKDPQQRPRSAAALAGLLPGHSPLSVAIAAGETPSPDMVAAVDAGEGLSMPQRAGLIAGTCLILLLVVLLSSHAFSRFGTERVPAVLVDQASQILEQFQIPRGSAQAWGYVADRRGLRWLASRGLPPSAGDDVTTAAYFWYRENPTYMAPLVPDWKGDAFLTVDELRPPPAAPGDVHLRLDGTGRLRYLSILPPAEMTTLTQPSTGANEDVAWEALFELAGLTSDQVTSLEPIEADFTPPGFADQRRSWTLPGDADSAFAGMRIDAASWHARPSFFRIVYPWDGDPAASRWNGITSGNQVLSAIMLIWVPVLIGLSGWLAHKNIASRRADRQGANRLAAFCAAAVLLLWLFGSTHLPAALELDLFVTALAGSTLMATVVWAAYVAFEPLVRRHWPRTLVSWSRLLQGQWTDSLVGRDLLIGIAAGAFAAMGKLLIVETPVVLQWGSYGLPNIYNFAPLAGLRVAIGEVIAALGLAILYSLFFQLLFLMALHRSLRRTWLAVTVFVLFLSCMVAVQYKPSSLAFAITAIEMTMTAALYLRVGLLAAVTMHFVRLLLKWPLTSDTSQWYAETGGMALAVIGLLLGFAVYTTRRPVGREPADVATVPTVTV